MKKLIYPNPISYLPRLSIEDIELMQDAYMDGFNALASVTGASTFIISGCKLEIVSSSPDVTRLTAGWVYMNNEICKVNETTFNTDPNTLYNDFKMDIVSTILAPSPVEHEDLVNRDIHYNRTATLVYNSPYVPANAFYLLKTYNDLMVSLNIGTWNAMSLGSGWGNGLNPVDNPHYRLEHKRVFLKGDIKFSGTIPTVNTPVFTLPVGFRPTSNKMYNVLCNRGWHATDFKSTNLTTDSKSSWLYVDIDGRIFADPAVVTSIVLDGISWETT